MVSCIECGVENLEDEEYCTNCGTSLSDQKFEEWKKGLSTSKKKSPLAAALLNLLIAGLGFVYIKDYVKAIISFVIVFISVVLSLKIGSNTKILGFGALIFIMIWSYLEAKKYSHG